MTLPKPRIAAMLLLILLVAVASSANARGRHRSPVSFSLNFGSCGVDLRDNYYSSDCYGCCCQPIVRHCGEERMVVRRIYDRRARAMPRRRYPQPYREVVLVRSRSRCCPRDVYYRPCDCYCGCDCWD